MNKHFQPLGHHQVLRGMFIPLKHPERVWQRKGVSGED